MCRLAPVAGLLALVLTALAGPVAAQDGLDTAERADLEREIERLEALFHAMDEEAELRALTVHPSEFDFPVVEEVVGPIRISAPSDLMPAVTGGVRDAVAAFILPIPSDGSWPERRLVVADRLSRTPAGLAADGTMYIRSGRFYLQTSALRRHAMDGARRLLLAALPDPPQEWSSSSGWTSGGEREFAFRELLRTRHPSAVSCVQARDTSACMDFLGLDYDGSADRRRALIAGWYPTAELRVAAARDVSGSREAPQIFPFWVPCVEAPDAAACHAELATDRFFWHAIPAGGATRGSLVAHALGLADAEGTSRMMSLDPEATAGEYLAALSGLSQEELVASWLEEVLQRTRDASPLRSIFLMWPGALVMLSFLSTRWRLG